RPELIAVRDAVGQRIFEVAADAVVGLHRHDVCAIGQQEQVLGNLQVMGAGIVSAGEKADRLHFARVPGVEDRDAVAEHMANVEVSAVVHHLNAVGTPADVAPGEVFEATPNAFSRHRFPGDGGAGLPSQLPAGQRESPGDEALRAIPAVDRAHALALTRPYTNSGQPAQKPGTRLPAPPASLPNAALISRCPDRRGAGDLCLNAEVEGKRDSPQSRWERRPWRLDCGESLCMAIMDRRLMSMLERHPAAHTASRGIAEDNRRGTGDGTHMRAASGAGGASC